MLSSKTNALLTHTLASFWRKQSCVGCTAHLWVAAAICDVIFSNYIQWEPFVLFWILRVEAFTSHKPLKWLFDVMFDVCRFLSRWHSYLMSLLWCRCLSIVRLTFILKAKLTYVTNMSIFLKLSCIKKTTVSKALLMLLRSILADIWEN